MSDFFRNDFSQDRWRRAALKNAFDLLGKQRFEHAAGFFLLAGSLNDAIEVRKMWFRGFELFCENFWHVCFVVVIKKKINFVQ